jgi:hypothetical protein
MTGSSEEADCSWFVLAEKMDVKGPSRSRAGSIVTLSNWQPDDQAMNAATYRAANFKNFFYIVTVSTGHNLNPKTVDNSVGVVLYVPE